MKCNLGSGDLLRLAGGAEGVVLVCLSGTVWLTKGDGVDYLVHAGGELKLEPGASAVVEGLGAAEFRLEQTSCQKVRPAAALSLKACRALS